MRDSGSQPAFHAAARQQLAQYAGDAVPPSRARSLPPPPADAPGFHRTLSLLREHPAVLQALGLIIELRLASGALPERAIGVVRVGWKDAPVGLPAILSPWSRYSRPDFHDTVSAGHLRSGCRGPTWLRLSGRCGSGRRAPGCRQGERESILRLAMIVVADRV